MVFRHHGDDMSSWCTIVMSSRFVECSAHFFARPAMEIKIGTRAAERKSRGESFTSEGSGPRGIIERQKATTFRPRRRPGTPVVGSELKP